ncbi:MAG TPA: hypothetical protein DIC50_04570 [Verrucomicrobia subdivision 3 bacterium]|nr:hypothetical protein [Limisphaerales bacterium]
MLHGDFLGLVPGRGTEPGETRAYSPGDDVRRIDWNVTARMQDPYIRETIADRELEAWLVVDRSARLDFGTATCEKRDLALAAAAGVGLLTGRGGNRVGALILRGSELTTVPPRNGRTHLLGILERIMSTPRGDGSGTSDLAATLKRAGAIAPRRGLVVVISDFLDDPDRWRTALGTVALRHAAGALLQQGVRELVVVHFPEGAFARTRKGDDFWQPALKLPPKYIAGTAGAGDAFCAGVLYGLHESWDLQRCLLTGVCIAAASLADATCTTGVKALNTSLALARKFGFGAPLDGAD